MAADLAGLHPAVRAKWAALLTDPVAQQHSLYIVSAYRSPDLQAKLFADAVKKYGSEAAARKWVAPAWRSNHGPVLRDDGTRVALGPNKGGKWGCAVDLGAPNVQAVSGRWPQPFKAQVDDLCARYGFMQVMPWEDWHFEPTPAFNYATPEDDVLNDADKKWIADQIAAAQKALIDEIKGTEGNINTHISWVGPDGYKHP